MSVEKSDFVSFAIEARHWEARATSAEAALTLALARAEAAEKEVERLKFDHLRDIRAARELRGTDEHAGVMGVLRARLAHSVERNDALWVNPYEAPHLLAPAPAEAEQQQGNEEGIG